MHMAPHHMLVCCMSGGSMNSGRFGTKLEYSMIAVVAFMCFWPSLSLAQDHDSRGQSAKQAGELVRIVRESTERFRDVSVAEGEQYKLMFGCVTGPDSGAMGLHFVNMGLVT